MLQNIMRSGVGVVSLLALAGGVEAAPFDITNLANTYVADPVSAAQFTSAGLGAKSSWSFVTQPLSFTQQAVTATYTLRLATLSHRFGTSSTGPSYSTFNVIFDSDDNGVGSSTTVIGAANPFLFWFDSFNGVNNINNGGAFTDGQGTSTYVGTHNIAVYVRDGIYALFYDDAGPRQPVNFQIDDDDYNDMVVTVAIPEPGTIALVGAGLFGLGVAARRRKQA